MVRAIDMKDYYRIPADSRDLNYNNYLDDGQVVITQASEYNSHNTRQLSVDELAHLIVNLEETKEYYQNPN
jgi:UDP-glucose 4-epimerase